MSKYLDYYKKYECTSLLLEEDIDKLLKNGDYDDDLASRVKLTDKQFDKLLKSNCAETLATNNNLTANQIEKLIVFCNHEDDYYIIESILENCKINFNHYLLCDNKKIFNDGEETNFHIYVFNNKFISNKIKERVIDYMIKKEIFK